MNLFSIAIALLAPVAFTLLGAAHPAQLPTGPRLPTPAEMRGPHAGKALIDLSLSEDEMRELIRVAWQDNEVQNVLNSEDELKSELVGTRVDMGEGVSNGLVLQGSARLCRNSNCLTWFFRRRNDRWQQIAVDNSHAAAHVSLFAFVKTDGERPLDDLVLVRHARGDDYPYWVFQFDEWTSIYNPRLTYCWHERKATLDRQGCAEFQAPEHLTAATDGAPILRSGLSQREVSQIVSAIMKAGPDGLPEDVMDSATALRKYLLVFRVNMGEGAQHGLVVSGGQGDLSPLCGVTGNCPIWLFRNSGDQWIQVGNAGGGGFAFVSPKHNGLRDLVVHWGLGGGESSFTRLEFDGTAYRGVANYCSRGRDEVLEGQCDVGF